MSTLYLQHLNGHPLPSLPSSSEHQPLFFHSASFPFCLSCHLLRTPFLGIFSWTPCSPPSLVPPSRLSYTPLLQFRWWNISISYYFPVRYHSVFHGPSFHSFPSRLVTFAPKALQRSPLCRSISPSDLFTASYISRPNLYILSRAYYLPPHCISLPRFHLL